MCVCVSVHVHVCVCVYVHVHVCVYVHVTSMCVCMYMYTSVCIPPSYVHLWIVLSLPYTSSYTHCRLDVASKATTLVHSIFGGYLRSRGMYVPVIEFEYISMTTKTDSGTLATITMVILWDGHTQRYSGTLV